jgi:hypothetical protein
VIIGFDYESFSPDGGTPHFQHAQTIVNNAQSLSERGWKAYENNHNRYWLMENLLNVSFKPMRAGFYKYHRLGFDKMSDDVAMARVKVMEAISDMKKVYLEKPNSFLMQFFFNAKSDELVNLFSQGSGDEKNQALQTLSLIDPGNISKYNTIASGSK